MLGQGTFVRSLTGAAGDDRRRITFSREAVQDIAATERAGRPIFRDEERIEIAFPGNQLNIWHGRVTDEHRQAYAREYEAFLKGEEVAIDGTPIEELAVLSKAMVKELKWRDVYTIEDGASLSETAIQTMGMGARKLRELCQRYLETAKGQAPLVELVAIKENLEGKNALLETQLAEMNRMLVGMQAQLNAYAQPTRPPETVIPNYPTQGVALPLPDDRSALDGIGETAPRQKRSYNRKAA